MVGLMREEKRQVVEEWEVVGEWEAGRQYSAEEGRGQVCLIVAMRGFGRGAQ